MGNTFPSTVMMSGFDGTLVAGLTSSETGRSGYGAACSTGGKATAVMTTEPLEAFVCVADHNAAPKHSKSHKLRAVYI